MFKQTLAEEGGLRGIRMPLQQWMNRGSKDGEADFPAVLVHLIF